MTPWTIALQAPLSMEFSRQEYWNGLPFPSPGDLLDPRIEPGSPVLAGRFFYYLSHQGSPLTILKVLTNIFQVLGCQGKFYVFSISCCPNCHGGCRYAQKGFPGSTNGKESACNVRDTGSISGSGRCPGEGNGLISVILPGEFHGQSRLVSYTPWGCKESDRAE